MRTSSRPAMSSTHSHHSHNPRQAHGNKSTTPITSPRLPHSVGQPHPPGAQLSPAATRDGRTPSPNYFGLNIEPGTDPRDSGALPRDNWSPATSSVKSFGAAIPKQMPLDANPDFEAFKRQADLNRGKSFALGSAQFAGMPPPPSSLRPRPARRTTEQSDAALDSSGPRPVLTRSRETTGSRMDLDADSLHDSAYVSSDSKRNSEVSLNAPSFFDAPKQESPAQTDSPFHPLRRSNLSQVEDAHPRLSLPQKKLDRSAPDAAKPRSETLPCALDSGGPSLLMPDQLRDIIRTKPEKDYLLLDVRVSTHYAQSRIQGALNLCIPTTLLKRATFDIQKLKKTLQTEEDQDKFSQWDSVKYLVIYDAASSEKRDAMSAMNMFKKFTNEGFSKESYLLRGGFNAFAEAHPELIDHRSAAERAGHPADTATAGGRPTFAPVIGGVTLPATANNPNPFFSNIRQNMDLADGVGQMDIAIPNNIDAASLPQWLRDATSRDDHGKGVANKFLSIERGEQARMKEAYSAFNAAAAPKTPTARVSLSGIEKGVKNRYKDILPFDHARVVLANKPKGACDYINASHVRAPRSNKRYIASQGPLPATFDDFWSVIWDQDVRVIVMLTAESEGGQLKCHSYWKDREYGPVKLRPLSEKKVSLDIDKHKAGSSAHPGQADSGRRRANTTTTLDSSAPTAQPPQSEAPYVIIRKFAMSHAAHPFAPMREVTHLHYPSWPDFGVPAQPSHLLALVELANVMQRSALPVDANRIAASVAGDRQTTPSWYEEPENDGNVRPMLVHCSAGCGRTGTFCTVDSVIDMLKRQRLASMAAKRKRDADGDVSMDNPASSFPSPQGHPSTQGNDANGRGGQLNLAGSSHASLDTRWVGDDSLDLISKTVEDFREQRLSMVQSLRQFVLCYETITEWVWRLQEQINANGRRGHFRSESEAPIRR